VTSFSDVRNAAIVNSVQKDAKRPLYTLIAGA